MAEQDSFIQEVTEEVRRDRMFAVWKKYGPIAIGAVVLLIAGTAAKGWWDSRIEAEKQQLGSRMLAAAEIEDPIDAAEAFSALAAEGGYAYPVLAKLRAAQSFAAGGEVERAIALYEEVSAAGDADARLRELAQLRIVMLQSETAEPASLLSRLAELSAPGAPWRMTALEFEAAAHLRAGDADAAIASLQSIIDDEAALPTAAARARELIEAVRSTRDTAAVAAEDDAGEEQQ